MQPISEQAKRLLHSQLELVLKEELYNEMGLVALGFAYLDWRSGVTVLERIFEQLVSMGYYSSEKTLLQPPLFGFLLAGFYELAPDEQTALEFLKKNYAQVFDFHRFLYEHRDPEEDGLLVVTHTDEYLLLHNYDNRSEVKHDPIAWKKQLQDPLFNALLIWSNECLLEIGTLLGEDVTDILLWNELTTFSLDDKLWWEDANCYQSFDLASQEAIPLNGLEAFMPLIGEIPDQDQAELMLEVLKSDAFNYLFLPLPSEGTYAFPPDTKISIIANWLLYHGLWRFGMTAAAGKLRQFSLDLMERYGFRAVYDLSNGISAGDREGTDYLPAAALCLAWLEEES